jgi:hypothetical protein
VKAFAVLLITVHPYSDIYMQTTIRLYYFEYAKTFVTPSLAMKIMSKLIYAVEWRLSKVQVEGQIKFK